jgi:hypothetical protein
LKADAFRRAGHTTAFELLRPAPALGCGNSGVLERRDFADGVREIAPVVFG